MGQREETSDAVILEWATLDYVDRLHPGDLVNFGWTAEEVEVTL